MLMRHSSNVTVRIASQASHYRTILGKQHQFVLQTYLRPLRSFQSNSNAETPRKRTIPNDNIPLSHFVASNDQGTSNDHDSFGPIPLSSNVTEDLLEGEMEIQELKFHLKTYGCQMNVSDSDIIRSILLSHETNARLHGVKFIETQEEMDADILLTNTCAIRENAESKVFHRLKELRAHDIKNPLPITEHGNTNTSSDFSKFVKKKSNKRKRVVGVLGCMAERLKDDLFKEGKADLVAGPDSYRDLPRLLSALIPKPFSHELQPLMERALNVELSFDETYADIKPIRANHNDVSAFVSVMRGCNNMCSYCVVPFTRGRERSRELESIVNEARHLVEEEGVKEIVLLGQNVNSYHDKSDKAVLARPLTNVRNEPISKGSYKSGYQTSNEGFSNIFRLRGGAGYYFVDLVEAVSDISPELRVRFTSPHPKDYPTPLLSLMAERHNICNHLHMPAQSGSSTVLERMRRGYTREAYLNLIHDVKAMIPDVAISSDFITGFCGETESEHQETLSLIEQVAYDQAFMFAYSMRGKTHAHRTMEDDVSEDIKSRRLQEIISMFRNTVQLRNDDVEVGRLRLVLVEGESRKSSQNWGGRTDQNKRITFPIKGDTPKCWSEESIKPLLQSLSKGDYDPMARSSLMYELVSSPKVELKKGDYACVKVTEARGHVLRGSLMWRASMKGFEDMGVGLPNEKDNPFANIV